MNLYKSLRSRLWENVSLTMKELRAKVLGYKSYTVALTQSGVPGNNCAIPKKVFENTLDLSMVCIDYDPGSYRYTLNKNIFKAGSKVDIFITSYNYYNISSTATTNSFQYAIPEGSDNILDLYQSGGYNAFGFQSQIILEIRVYS